MFVPPKPFQFSNHLWVRQEPTQVKHLSSAPLSDRLLAVSTNNRLGWKCLQGANALAHYENSQLMAVKSFITLAQGVNVMKLCFGVIYERFQRTDVSFERCYDARGGNYAKKCFITLATGVCNAPRARSHLACLSS